MYIGFVIKQYLMLLIVALPHKACIIANNTFWYFLWSFPMNNEPTQGVEAHQIAGVSPIDPIYQSQEQGLHKGYIRSLNLIDRDVLGKLAGVSGAYITSLCYRKSNTCSLQVALAIDKHSDGALDFRKLVGETEDVDWKFVKRKLRTLAPA